LKNTTRKKNEKRIVIVPEIFSTAILIAFLK